MREGGVSSAVGLVVILGSLSLCFCGLIIRAGCLPLI